MQQPTPAGQLKLGVAQAPHRAPCDPYMQFAACYHSQDSFRWHLRSKALQFLPGPPPPWVGVRVWLWVGKYSTKSLSLTVPRWA